VGDAPTVSMNSHTGTFQVSTREATVVDLVDRPRQAGGLSNVATIVREIGDLDGAEVARLSALRPRSHARRLGWLLDRFHGDIELADLQRAAQPGWGQPTPLSPGGRRAGEPDSDWGVLVNTNVEPDV
jgi:predicted transcriptional regulator of viral defense system